MSAINRKPIFAAVRSLRGDKSYTLAEVQLLDKAIDEAFSGVIGIPISVPSEVLKAPAGRRVSSKGIALIHSFETCVLKAYKDPGSGDGLPITIGWGSTSDLAGNPIALGTVWTQTQADAKFAQDMASFGGKVDALLGDAATNQNQFDACCSLSYNIGVDAFRKSTVLRKHKAGDYTGAAAAFAMWIKNDGKIMRGLVRRRAAEADLYDDL